MTNKEIIRNEVERRLNVMSKSAWGTDEFKKLLDFIDSMQEDPCDGCTNKKGCITCENGELRETVQEEPKQKMSVEEAMTYIDDKSKAFTEAHKGESADEILSEMRGEEPVSEVWYNARKTLPESSTKQIICIKEDELAVSTVGKIVTGTVKWAYLDTLLHISNKNLTESQCRKLIDTAFELGKAANKNKPISDDLNEAARQITPKVLSGEATNFYNDDDVVLSDEEECFKAGAKWQKSHLWKLADGDDLPEIDREVIVLVKYSTQRNIHDKEYPTYIVGFGHRPNPDGWDGRNIDTGVVTHYTPKLYDKGGWNVPDIAYWLDCSLPNMED